MYVYVCVGGCITIIIKEEVMNLRGNGGHSTRWKGRRRIKNYINIVFIYEV